MKDRIAKIIKKEQLTSQQFAEIIDIQSSTISHILAGRNLPSFKIISNLLERFPKVSPDWLIFGRGEMYRVIDKSPITAEYRDEIVEIDSEFTKLNFDNEIFTDIDEKSSFYNDLNEPMQDQNYIIGDMIPLDSNEEPIQAEIPVIPRNMSDTKVNTDDLEGVKDVESRRSSNVISGKSSEKMVDKIIIMYCDKTFEIYDPKV